MMKFRCFYYCENANKVINYIGEKHFPTKMKQGVKNCFKSLISSVFTTIPSRLKPEQKEKQNKS